MVIQSCFRKNCCWRTNASIEAPGSSQLSGNGIAVASVPGSPPFCPCGHGRDRSRRCRGLSRRVAARDASAASRRRRVRHETRMDAWKLRWIASSASLTTGLWPERCVAGTAGLLRGPCGPGGCARPVVAAFGQARPRGRRGIGYGQPALRSPGDRPGSRLRGCPRAGGRWCPRCASCHLHLPRLHAPEPRTGAPVLASVRRASGETRTVRSNGAAPVGAGGKWAELWGTPGNARKCVRERLASARPRYGRAGEAPCHSGAARHAVGSASVVR